MNFKELKIAPSILSSDFSLSIDALNMIAEAGLDYVHLDVMDGFFVPVITFGPKFIKDLRNKSDLIFDVHLMIDRPERMLDQFIDSGADIITVHAESTNNLSRCIDVIKSAKIEVGVAINPGTSVSFIEDILDRVDYVLVMTVSPGYSGQPLIKSTLKKIAKLDQLRSEYNYSYLISSDGGINENNINELKMAGVDIAVMGSAFFNEPDKSSFLDRINMRLSEL